MFCPKCGTKIGDFDKFCNNCGWKNKLTYKSEGIDLSGAKKAAGAVVKAADAAKDVVVKNADGISKKVDKFEKNVADKTNAFNEKIADKIFNFFESENILIRTLKKANCMTIISAFLFRYAGVLVPFVKIKEFDSRSSFADFGNIYPTFYWLSIIENAIQEYSEMILIFLFTIYPFVLIFLSLFNNVLTNIIVLLIGIILNGFMLALVFYSIPNDNYVYFFNDNYMHLPYTDILIVCSTILLILSCIIGIKNRIKYKKSLKLNGGK